MADLVLRLNGQPIAGATFKEVVNADHLVTPPVRRAGVMQDHSALGAESRNQLFARVFHVAITAASNLVLDQTLAALKELEGRERDIVIVDEEGVDSDVMVCEDWIIDHVEIGPVPDAYGGRFCEDVAITAAGEEPPDYP